MKLFHQLVNVGRKSETPVDVVLVGVETAIQADFPDFLTALSVKSSEPTAASN
jgi:hypothetical protein